MIVLYILLGIVIGIVLISICIRLYIKTHFKRVKKFHQNGREIELKPCPFCGGNYQEIATAGEDGKKSYTMVCDATQGGCGCSTGWSDKTLDVVLMWNERAYEKEK